MKTDHYAALLAVLSEITKTLSLPPEERGPDVALVLIRQAKEAIQGVEGTDAVFKAWAIATIDGLIAELSKFDDKPEAKLPVVTPY